MRIAAFIKSAGRAIGIGLVEFLAIDRHAPLRSLVRRANAHRLRQLEPHFDAAVYTRQIRSPWRRRRASHDPLLHYLLIGWREARAPNARLDPVFLGHEMRADERFGEPLLHLLSSAGGIVGPQNEIETVRPVGVETRERALVLHHGRGGGSTKFLAIFEDALRSRGIEPVRLRLLSKSDRLVVWPGSGNLDVLDLVDDAADLIERARRASIKLVVVSHLIDFDTSVIFERIERVVAELASPLWVILHDYFCVCPRVNLIDSRGQLCRIPDAAVCVACSAAGGTEIGRAGPSTWRSRFLAFLAKADRVFVPSDDARLRLGGFVAKPLEVWRPETDGFYKPVVRPALDGEDRLSVAILGSLNEAKGSRLVLELARLIKKQRVPIDIVIYGETDISVKLRNAGVSITGRYRDTEIESLLLAAAPHLALMPAIWPETWSFVLTTALKCSLPIMAFAHGAQFERLRQLGRDELLLPVDWIDKPEWILASLMKFRATCLPTHGEFASERFAPHRRSPERSHP